MEGSGMNFPTSDLQFLARLLRSVHLNAPGVLELKDQDRYRLNEIANKGFSSPADAPDVGGGTD